MPSRQFRLRRQMRGSAAQPEECASDPDRPHVAHHSKAFSADISSVGNRGSLYLSSLQRTKDGSTTPPSPPSAFSGLVSAESTPRKSSSEHLCPLPCSGLSRQDAGSVTLLLLLYTLQGVPMGLSASIPFLLSDKVSYSSQAMFSLVSLPFSFKLVWAPIVDSTRLPPLGRRKSWLIPVQLLCGLLMIAAAPVISHWMGDVEGNPTADVRTLTIYFLFLYFLMATQDIAVDGWALTMLSKENVGYASTCNTIGQTLGYFMAHVGFLALNSAETCNKFLRSTPQDTGLVSLGGFMWFWGWVFLLTTVFVVFKQEDADEGDGAEVGVVETYRQLIRILRLPNVQALCLVLLTNKVAFAVTDSATSLKLVEYGMPKEEIALMSPLLVITGIAIPVLLTRYTSGPRPLDVFINAFVPRLGVGVLYALLLPLAKWAYHVPGLSPFSFRLYFILCVLLREVVSNSMFVAQMAFFARISDPNIGGTYMTLLNTVSNLGGTWVKLVSLGALDYLTTRACVRGGREMLPMEVVCGRDPGAADMCRSMGGECTITVEGYNLEVLVCTVVGLVWFYAMNKTLTRLQDTKEEEWQITHSAEDGGFKLS